MESIILDTPEETIQIYTTEEEIANIVQLKVKGTICDIIISEGEVNYTTDIRFIHLLQ